MSAANLIPLGVVEVRREICGHCPAKCAPFIAGELFHAEPCAQCPASPRRWGPYGQCGKYAANHLPTPAPVVAPAPAAVAQGFGLGDLVATVAQPIAKAIDAVAGTNVAGCGGCAQRRAALNKAMPNILPRT